MSSTGTVIQLSETYVSGGPCWKCGVTIVMPQHFYKSRQNDHESFYCVNGHSGAFQGKTETEKKLEAAESQLEWSRAEAKRAKEAQVVAERKASAARGEVTRIKNRVANGVCPCCNRTFQNLMRHMHTKHPEYKDAKP
jgi:hypothetical protein